MHPMDLTPNPTTDRGSNEIAAVAVAFGMVDAAHRRFRTHIARELGITIGDLTALIVISDNEETTPKMLAAELGHSSGTVTAMIDRLTDAGHVSRAPKAGDRRSILVALTAKGSATIAIVWRRYIDAVALAVELSPRLTEQDSLSSLQRTAEAIDIVGGQAAQVPPN